MKKALILCYLVCLQAFAFAQAESVASLWNEANSAFENKQYEVAIDKYKAMLNSKNVDADVYYNLANAYYKNEENGKAIANYLKALKLNPNLKAAEQSLAFVQAQLDLSTQITDNSSLTKSINLLPANAWAWMGLAAFMMVCFLFYKSRQQKWKHGNKYLIAISGLSFLFIACSLLSYQSKALHNKAVVLRANTFLYEDAKKSKVKWNLPEGTILNVEQKTNDKLFEVSMNNGIQGWVAGEDLEKI